MASKSIVARRCLEENVDSAEFTKRGVDGKLRAVMTKVIKDEKFNKITIKARNENLTRNQIVELGISNAYAPVIKTIARSNVSLDMIIEKQYIGGYVKKGGLYQEVGELRPTCKSDAEKAAYRQAVEHTLAILKMKKVEIFSMADGAMRLMEAQ